MPHLIAAGITYPVRAILFDKDGTLMDFTYTWGDWSKHMLARFSAQLEAKGLASLPSSVVPSLWGTDHATDGTVTGYDPNGPLAMGTAEDLLNILAWQGYQLGMSWAEAKVAVNECKAYADGQLDIARTARALPGVVAFLEKCLSAGIALAVVTADETAAANKHLEWLGIRHYFAAVIGTDMVEQGKPYPDMVHLACRELHVDSDDVVVIGDTNGDMIMARSAGAAAAIGFAGTEGGGATLKPQTFHDADIIIASYDELVIEKPLLSFQVITDTHLTGNSGHIYNRHFQMALQDIRTHAHESRGIMHVGDVTDHGFPAEYKELKRIWSANRDGLPDMYFTSGNHDVAMGIWKSRLKHFLDATGMKGPYHDHWIDGYHFIFLGTEKGLRKFCTLSKEQLNWLDTKLGEDARPDKPVFVFLHQPLLNTVAGSYEQQGWNGVTEDAELKEVLSRHRQAIMFSGHTHWELEARNNAFDGEGRLPAMFNAASVAYLWTDEDERKQGSQGYYVEVYPDHVQVMGRDFEQGTWVQAAQFRVDYPVK